MDVRPVPETWLLERFMVVVDVGPIMGVAATVECDSELPPCGPLPLRNGHQFKSVDWTALAIQWATKRWKRFAPYRHVHVENLKKTLAELGLWKPELALQMTKELIAKCEL